MPKCPIHVFFKRLIPDYQISILCFLIDIDPILQNSHFIFLDRCWAYTIKNISCLLEDIDPIFKISKTYFLEEIDPMFKMVENTLDGSSIFFGTPLFQHFRCSIFRDSQKPISRKTFRAFKTN